MTEKQFKKINKLWKLLKVALEDINIVSQDKRYKLDMGHYWLSCLRKCVVCLAGSVLTNWFDYKDKVAFNKVDRKTKDRLQTIDSLRHLTFNEAYYRLHDKPSKKRLALKFKKLRETAIDEKKEEAYYEYQSILGIRFNKLRQFENFDESLSFYKWIEAELKELNV